MAGAALLILASVMVAGATGRSASPLTWFLSRASGLTLYLLLWLTVVLGLGITTKRFDRIVGRAVIYSLHTFVTQLSYGFLAMHLLALLADAHVPFGLVELVVPFKSGASEPWTGLGVIAAWLLLLIALSGPARRWISFAAWRRIHVLSFVLFALALVHGIGAGSDSRTSWAFGLYLLSGLTMLALMLFRALRWRKRWETAPPPKSLPVLDRLAS